MRPFKVICLNLSRFLNLLCSKLWIEDAEVDIIFRYKILVCTGAQGSFVGAALDDRSVRHKLRGYRLSAN